MRLNVTDVGMDLFRDIHIVHQKCLIFRLRAVAHRMVSFGFENFINTYSPREIVMLAALMFEHQHNALVLEAHKRGDDALKAYLVGRLPYLFRSEAA